MVVSFGHSFIRSVNVYLMPNLCHGSEEKIMSTGKPVPPAPGVYYWSSVQASRRDDQIIALMTKVAVIHAFIPETFSMCCLSKSWWPTKRKHS